jgi:hypothetical protein
LGDLGICEAVIAVLATFGEKNAAIAKQVTHGTACKPNRTNLMLRSSLTVIYRYCRAALLFATYPPVMPSIKPDLRLAGYLTSLLLH